MSPWYMIGYRLEEGIEGLDVPFYLDADLPTLDYDVVGDPSVVVVAGPNEMALFSIALIRSAGASVPFLRSAMSL